MEWYITKIIIYYPQDDGKYYEKRINLMNIATIIFTYNRSYHTQKVLEGLKNGEILPGKLFVFQDGLKKEEHREEWEKVKAVIHSINWCDVEVVEATVNKGLANAICSGINYVFQQYDAIIVLEDDCVPHYKFMTYMRDSLIKYEEYNQVHSISGYTNPVLVPSNGADAYFTRRAQSLGWGTWKNRWQEYRMDYRMVYDIKCNPELKRQYYIWGPDLELYLHGNVDGRCNSWAVFWSLQAIKNEQYCLAPYESLIKNIGFDGTGVHSGEVSPKQFLHNPESRNDLKLPDRVEFPDNYEEIFTHFFSTTSKEKKLEVYNGILSRWVSVGDVHMLNYFAEKKVTNIAIWGTGRLCDLLMEKISKQIRVDYIIKSTVRENERYKGIPIFEIEQIDGKVDLIIIIPIYDIENIVYKHPELRKYKYIGIDELIG